MSQPQSLLHAGDPHLNHGLFADHYLNVIVPRRPEWDEALFAEARQVFETLKTLRATLHPERLDEAPLEQQWVQPVLQALGHHFSVQLKVRYGERGYRKPDYAFFDNEADVRAITDAIYNPADITHALAVGDAKRWGINLDQTPQGRDERNPSQQIDQYLRYSELPWGILTDGRFWRLYHRDSSKYNRYYAVDLDDLLSGDDVDRFLYFYAFFRRQALSGGWLATVLAGSEEFAQKLTDKLETEVYDALEMIAQGFLDYRRNRLFADPATLRQIYEQSLILLYRMLFVFYAESREILPLHQNDEYTSRRSLRATVRAVKQALDANQRFHPDSSDYYTRLRDLFFVIDEGDPRLDMPPYNGHLFSEADHSFLRDNTVGDFHLVPALDKLARVDSLEAGREARVFVDYRDLDVRHLGSIYEKLLDYELVLADRPLALKGIQYVEAGPGDVVVKQPGQVYLRTGNNERKVTGSYYTPDYIVRFIVEKTLEPLLVDITARHADLDESGEWRVRDGHADALVNEVLALNVLDPATGSGHFIVDATAYMAEWLRNLNLRPDDLGQEDELVYWKRLVAGACVYAVDINPLAVELAKLSMWLTTLAQGRPLSFLDHHLRVGNSLVGARLNEITDRVETEKRRQQREKTEAKRAAAGQAAMFGADDFTQGVRFAVGQMSAIEHTVAASVTDVKHQEALYGALRDRLGVWEDAANVWTARAFGLDITQAQWEVVRKLTTRNQRVPEIDRIVAAATEIAGRADLRFFHWELAFPEIFFDADGQPLENPGFDAVIGNPPYVRWQSFSLELKNYLQANYAVYNSSADLFLYFYEHGLRLLKPNERLAYITSGTYMNSNSAKAFRGFIHRNAALEWLANFGENQPFKAAEMVYPTIIVMRRGTPNESFRSLFFEGIVRDSELESTLRTGEWVDSLSMTTALDEWRFQSKDLTILFQKFSRAISLAEFTKDEIYYGVLTGLNDAFVIDDALKDRLIAEHPSSAGIIAPMLRGQDLRPWYQMQNPLHLIVARQGIDIDSYPAIKRHLEQFHEVLEVRPADWDIRNGKWKGRTAGNYKWYEWHDVVAYYEKFQQPKIVWADIGKLPRYSWDEGSYLNNTGFFLANPTFSLLGLLQSRALWFALSQFATPLRLRGGLWQYRAIIQFVRRLPIPDLTAEQESGLAAIAEETTALAGQRYRLHEDFRQTLSADFGGGQPINSRVALFAWWALADDRALDDELKRQFRAEIPLRDRGRWRAFLAEQQAEHRRLTAQIVTLETRLNATVYDAFALTPDERALIESTTKYPYGAV